MPVVQSRRVELVTFFALAYGVAWLLWLPLVLSTRGVGILAVSGSMTWMLPGLFAPTIAALITRRSTAGDWGIATLFGRWNRAWLGLLAGPVLIALAVIVLPALMLTTTSWRSLHWDALASLPWLIVTWTSLRGGPLGEEPGWRGFALPRLEERFGSVGASLVLGVLWACWHLPLFLVRDFSSSPFPTFVLTLTALSMLMTCVMRLSGGNLLAAIATHSAFNSASRVLNRVLEGAGTRDVPAAELIIALSLAAVAVVVSLTAPDRG